MDNQLKWLCEQEPWVAYRTRIDLLNEPQDSHEVQQSYEDLLKHPLIKGILDELQEWPGRPMKRHNDAKLLYHKLVFLADIGLTSDNSVILRVIKKILSNQSSDGPFNTLGNIPTVFGGSGLDEPVWMLCDAPLITYALVKMGLTEDPQVQKSFDYLISLLQDFGWPCAATSSLGKKFKGPGKRTDPCPYANLIMLKLLAAQPDMQHSKEAQKGIEVLLNLWEYRKEVKYFLFGMGTDFSKLKAPFIWYDILHVVDVLSQFEIAREDNRFKEIIEIILLKSDNEGLFKAESIYLSWKGWDFGQKKIPSGWITYLVYHILKRMNYENKN